MKDLFYKALWFALGIIIGIIIVFVSDKNLNQIENELKAIAAVIKNIWRAILSGIGLG